MTHGLAIYLVPPPHLTLHTLITVMSHSWSHLTYSGVNFQYSHAPLRPTHHAIRHWGGVPSFGVPVKCTHSLVTAVRTPHSVAKVNVLDKNMTKIDWRLEVDLAIEYDWRRLTNNVTGGDA